MVVRRVVKLAVSFCLVLAIGATWVDPLFAQAAVKKDASAAQGRSPAAKEAAKTDTSKTEPAKKEESAKTEPPKATEPPLPPIPPEVQAKIDAARKAVAEAIVAAEDAGLVETSIDPPPILDILITGRATDLRTLKNTTAKKPYAVSPEVFGAWFTGYGKKDLSTASTTRTMFGSSTPAPGSSSGMTRGRGSWSSTSRRSARPRPAPKKKKPSRRKRRSPRNPRRRRRQEA